MDTGNSLILTAAPDFAELALDELHAQDANARVVHALADGVVLLELDNSSPDSFWTLAEAWRQQTPIFVRHIQPVQAELALTGTIADLDALCNHVAAELLPLVEPTLPFSVQTRVLTSNVDYKPFDLNRALSDLIQAESSAPLDVRNPEQILSIVITESTVHASTFDGLRGDRITHHAYLGLSPTAHNLSDWAGGQRRFRRDDEQSSRAEFKLLEALESFAIELPPRGVALDLGAAPGGWTRVLRQRDQFVTAVDPGALDARLADDPRVRHIHATAEEYLRRDPDQFDLIVNDMRKDARDAAQLMVDYAPQLYRHGAVITTLKLTSDDRRATIDAAFAILRRAYDIAGARQLFHNRSEITVYLKPKS